MQVDIIGGQGSLMLGTIDRRYLPEVLFPLPAVVAEPPPTIDQMVAAAHARLRVFIEAECDWLGHNIHKQFAAARLTYLMEDGGYMLRDSLGTVVGWQPKWVSTP